MLGVTDKDVAIAHDRVQEWSRRHEHAKPENAESEEGLELNADAVLNFLIYLRLPEDKVEERAVALAKAGKSCYSLYRLHSSAHRGASIHVSFTQSI